MPYHNPVLEIAEAKNLFLPERFDLTIREYDDVEVKRFHQARLRREGAVLKATYTDWARDRFRLLIDTCAGTAHLQSPHLEGTPDRAIVHLTRIVFRDVSTLLQRVCN